MFNDKKMHYKTSRETNILDFDKQKTQSDVHSVERQCQIHHFFYLVEAMLNVSFNANVWFGENIDYTKSWNFADIHSSSDLSA